MATTTLERLVVQLQADLKNYENAMRRAQGINTRTTKAIEQQWAKSNRNVSAGFVGVGKGLASAFAVGAGLRGAQKLIDSATRIQNSLKVAGLEGDNLSKVYDRLFASAQRNAAPLESLVTLYGRAALVQKELGVSSEELLRFTDNVALALRVAGSDAATASGALLQLSQALGSGTVRAEEFNSIQEGAQPILKAVAAGLLEAGGSVAKLRNLVIDGKVSSEAFFRAFEAGSHILNEQVAGSQRTISQGFQQLENVLVDAAGKLNDVTGASRKVVEIFDELARVINGLSNVFEAAANGPIGTFIGRLDALYDILQKINAFTPAGVLGTLLSDETTGKLTRILGPSAGPGSVNVAGGKQGSVAGPIDRRIDAAFGNVPPVSLAQFPVSGKTKKTGSKAESPFVRETRQIKERTSALIAETAAQSRLNPLVNDYGFALEKASATQELLNAAKRQGLAITPELTATIEQLATGYANASVAAEQLAEKQENIRQAAEDFADLGHDVMSGFINDMRNGVSATEALSNALNKVADKLLDIALSAVFDPAGGFGSFISGLVAHKGGVVGEGGEMRRVHPATFLGAPRMHSGGIAGLRSGEIPAILERGEIVLPKGASKGQGGVTTVDVRAYVDENGNWQAKVERISQSTTAKGLASYDSAKQRQSMTRG